jgi:hypothetical protein
VIPFGRPGKFAPKENDVTKKQKPPNSEEFLSTLIHVPWRKETIRCANLTADDMERFARLHDRAGRSADAYTSLFTIERMKAEGVGGVGALEPLPEGVQITPAWWMP